MQFAKKTFLGLWLSLALTPVLAEEARPFNIPGQPLASAIESLSQQSGLHVFYADRALQGRESTAVNGVFTPKEALNQMLAGSGIETSVTGENTVALKAATGLIKTAASVDGETLPKVTVEADTESPYDDPNWTNDPYNSDYNRPNANTATKTDTPIMETPYSIQVVPKQVLEDVQAIRPNDALDYVSGIYRSSGSGDFFESSNRRGFNNFPNGDYRDGAPFPIADYIIGGRDLANTERVEALKGPASLLYGMANPGGAVNYVTKKPLSTPYNSLQQQFGSYDLYRTTFDATGPVTKDDTLLYRFNLAYKSANSFRDLVDSERTFIAPAITWNISPRTQINFEMEYDTGHVVFDRGIPAIGNRPANLPLNRFTGEPVPYEYERIMAGFNWSHAFNDNWKISHRFNTQYVGQNGVATDVDGEVAADGTMGRFGLLTFQDPGDQPVYFNSLNLTGHFDTYGLNHTLLLGGDHYRHNIDTTQNFISSSINIYNPKYLGATAARGNAAENHSLSIEEDWFGLYFQDQIKLPYHLSMLAGFRYDSAKSIGDFDGSVFENPRQDSLTPRGGLIWQPLPELSLYGSYTENFSGVASIGAGGTLLPPESAQQWELGIKTELFDKRLMGTLAWFDLTKQNVSVFDTNTGFPRAIGEARTAGLELDLKGEILPGWNVIAAYAYTPDAEVTKGDVDEIGRRFRGVPEHGGSLFTTYDFQNGLLKGLKFGGGVIARSSQNTNVTDNTAVLPGYATVNLLASYGWKIGKTNLTTQFNVNNLLDKAYFPTSADRSDIQVGTPRTFMGSIRVEY